MWKNKKIKIGLTIVVFVLIFLTTTAISIQAANIGTVGGWLWGGGAESDGSAPWDGTNTNVGWIKFSGIAQDGSKYGVDIPHFDGNLSGYAWSENIGWVSFNASDAAGCPSSPCEAKRSGNNIIGWARIISIKDAYALGNSGGWLGWIRLSGTAQNGSAYGISIANDNSISGYAWSDELGWIVVNNGTNLAACAPTGVYSYDCLPGVCDSCVKVATTEPWNCLKTDSCGNPVPNASNAECSSNGKTCSDAVCQICPRVLNWREVSPN